MTPAARIELNGQDVTANWREALISLTVTDEAGVRSDAVEAEFDNRARFTAPPIGQIVKVWLGFEPTPVYMGAFRIDEWSKSGPPRTLKITAKAAELTTAIRATRSRSHHDTTLGSIVRQIAGEHRLGVAMDNALAARSIPHIDQQAESDLHFLTRLARRNGATFKLTDGRVVFTRRGSRQLPSGAAKPSTTIRPTKSTEWSVTNNERGGHKSVKCGYMDHGAGRRRFATAGSGEPVHRDRRLYGSQAEAQAAADAQLGDLTRGKRSGDLSGPGMPDLFAEGLIVLEGFDPDCDGEYLAKTVTHTLNGSGYSTSVTFETEGAESSPTE